MRKSLYRRMGQVSCLSSRKCYAPKKLGIEDCGNTVLFKIFMATSGTLYHKFVKRCKVCHFWHILNISILKIKLLHCFLNSSIEVSFTCHTIYPPKEYNSMAFNVFTKLCKHRHNFRTIPLLQKETPHS